MSQGREFQNIGAVTENFWQGHAGAEALSRSVEIRTVPSSHSHHTDSHPVNRPADFVLEEKTLLSTYRWSLSPLDSSLGSCRPPAEQTTRAKLRSGCQLRP